MTTDRDVDAALFLVSSQSRGVMKAWSLQEAKARFSQLVDLCHAQGPQLVTKRGKEAVIVVAAEDWARLQPLMRPSRKQVLVDEGPKGELRYPRVDDRSDRPL